MAQIGEKYSVPIETFGKNVPFNLKNLPPPHRRNVPPQGALPPREAPASAGEFERGRTLPAYPYVPETPVPRDVQEEYDRLLRR